MLVQDFTPRQLVQCTQVNLRFRLAVQNATVRVCRKQGVPTTKASTPRLLMQLYLLRPSVEEYVDAPLGDLPPRVEYRTHDGAGHCTGRFTHCPTCNQEECICAAVPLRCEWQGRRRPKVHRKKDTHRNRCLSIREGQLPYLEDMQTRITVHTAYSYGLMPPLDPYRETQDDDHALRHYKLRNGGWIGDFDDFE